MAKTKNKKEMLKQAKALKQARGRVTKEIKKKIDASFKALSYSIKATETKITVDFKTFEKNVMATLELTHKKSTKAVIDTIDKIYKIREFDNFTAIEDKILKSFNKKHSAETVRRISNVTREKINKIVTERQSQGINNKHIAKELRENVAGMAKSRSLTIARTETAKASGYSANELAKETMVNKKVWLHAGGGRTDRATHVQISGEEVGIDKPFSNGMMYAHEAGAGAKDVINCYCVTTYKFRI